MPCLSTKSAFSTTRIRHASLCVKALVADTRWIEDKMKDPSTESHTTSGVQTPGEQHHAVAGGNEPTDNTDEEKARAGRIGGWYLAWAGIAVCLGIIAGLALAFWTDVPDYKLAAGASAFALIYILAQAIERINELLILALDKGKKENFAEESKRKALKTIKDGQVGGTDAETQAGAEATLTKSRKELRILTMATAFGLSFALLAYLEMGLLKLVTEGDHPPLPLDWVISAAVFAGGTAALHDLTSKVQKSKEKDEAAA